MPLGTAMEHITKVIGAHATCSENDKLSVKYFHSNTWPQILQLYTCQWSWNMMQLYFSLYIYILFIIVFRYEQSFKRLTRWVNPRKRILENSVVFISYRKCCLCFIYPWGGISWIGYMYIQLCYYFLNPISTQSFSCSLIHCFNISLISDHAKFAIK